MACFLFASVPLVGHVNPALVIAQELIYRGHQVGWYAGKQFQKQIEALGAQFFPRRAARDFDTIDLEQVFPEKLQLRGLDSLKFDVKHLFLDSIPGHRVDLLEILKKFPADTLVSDSAFFGIETLSAELNCSWAVYGISCLPYHSVDTAPFGPGFLPGAHPYRRVRNRILNYVAENVYGRDIMAYYNNRLTSLGLSPSKHYITNLMINCADLYIQPTIPAFEYPRGDLPSTVQFIGACLPKSSTTFIPPPWWNDLQSGLPVVHVTQGTLSTNYQDLLIPTLQALANEECIVVATTGAKPLEAIPPDAVPHNARLTTYLPYDVLLPRVDVMVTNGGYGGVQQALAHGVPLVAGGDTEEKPEVCARVGWSGAGVDLKTGKPNPAAIRSAVKRVLEIPSFRMRAQRLQREYQRYNTPRVAANLLEQLASQTPQPHIGRFAVSA